jgi:hypothetical protein
MYVGDRILKEQTEPDHGNAILMFSRTLDMAFYPFSHHKHQEHDQKSYQSLSFCYQVLNSLEPTKSTMVSFLGGKRQKREAQSFRSKISGDSPPRLLYAFVACRRVFP